MRPHSLLAPVVTTIFRKMADIYNCRVGTWQQAFLKELFRVVFARRGRVNFTNLARYSPFCEQTFRRHFQKAFQWAWFNLTVLRLRRHPEETLIGVFDCSFLPKSGTETWGLDQFFSSAAGGTRRGLEVSVLGAIATESRRAFGLDATQTPPDLSQEASKEGYSRIDFYREQIQDLREQLSEAGMSISHWVGDGYYAKTKIFEEVRQAGSHLITRLRSDANLRYLYTGPPNGKPGANRQYDGKVNWNDQQELFSRFETVGRLPDQTHVRILTVLANSPHFGRNLRIVLLIDPDTPSDYVVLCSTDTEQPAEQVARYYRLRYQIEFVIRDAKQHTGLTHCQARSQEKIDFHLNVSLSAVGLLRLLAQKAECSPRTYRREAYNRYLIDRLFSELGLSTEFDLSDPGVQRTVRTGRMAV